MPLEERSLRPHSVMPKHLLRERSAAVASVDASAMQRKSETWSARLAAEPSHPLSGLAPVDQRSVQSGDIILAIGNGQLYTASSSQWTPLLLQPETGDTVYIEDGHRHVGTLHTIGDDGASKRAVHHATIITRDYASPQVIDTTPSPVGATTAVVSGDELTSLDPITYTAGVAGLYAITAIVCSEYIGLAGVTFWLSLRLNGADVCLLDMRVAISNYLYLSGATMHRLNAGDVVDITIAASAMVSIPVVTAEPKDARITITRVR